jgi:hypothetical protein
MKNIPPDVAAVLAAGIGDDGLMQRFQMTVWPDAPMTWKNIDRCPDAWAKGVAYKALERLANLCAADVEAESDDDDQDSLPFLHFDSDAQRLFDSWRADLEARLLTGEEHPAVESHLAKYRSLIPSLALISHILDGGVGPVDATSLRKPRNQTDKTDISIFCQSCQCHCGGFSGFRRRR